MLCLAVPSIMLHNLSLRAILYDAVLHLGNKFDLIWFWWVWCWRRRVACHHRDPELAVLAHISDRHQAVGACLALPLVLCGLGGKQWLQPIYHQADERAASAEGLTALRLIFIIKIVHVVQNNEKYRRHYYFGGINSGPLQRSYMRYGPMT